jgi:4-amino-4-deoxy-L-arabinose transferase-like glycosyltransferase
MRLFKFPQGARTPVMVAIALCTIVLLPTLRFAWHRLATVHGWEADQIARSLASGHGFSFRGDDRWLWPPGDPEAFFATAWVDPVFTSLLAGAHAAFGGNAYAAIYAMVGLCLIALLVMSYCLAQRFAGPWAGVLASSLIAAHFGLTKTFFADITNVALGATLALAAALAFVRYIEQRSAKRLVVVGLASGLAVLACPATQFFPLAAAALVLCLPRSDGWIRQAARSATVLALAGVVLAPWALRNYLVFDEFVLVRNGAGQIAWAGTVGPASTFMKTSAGEQQIRAPWVTHGPTEAVQGMLDSDKRAAMHRYQIAALAAERLPGYENMNEAERDRAYLARAKEFIGQHPVTSIELAFAKLHTYVRLFGLYGELLILAAIAGAIAVARDRRAWPLLLLAGTYTAPFVLIIPYFARYRAPIEPILAVLAAVGTVLWVSKLWAPGSRVKRNVNGNSLPILSASDMIGGPPQGPSTQG